MDKVEKEKKREKNVKPNTMIKERSTFHLKYKWGLDDHKGQEARKGPQEV